MTEQDKQAALEALDELRELAYGCGGRSCDEIVGFVETIRQALQPVEIDLEALKKLLIKEIDSDKDYGLIDKAYNIGVLKTLDHVAAKGHLHTPDPTKERYREALEFYAKLHDSDTAYEDWYEDEGKTARAALKETET